MIAMKQKEYERALEEIAKECPCLQTHAPLLNYCARKLCSAFSEEDSSPLSKAKESTGRKKLIDIFSFAKEEVRKLRLWFISGEPGEMNEQLVVALQFDISAGGLMERFEREVLIPKRRGKGLLKPAYRGVECAREERVFFDRESARSSSVASERKMYELCTRRIKDAFYMHDGAAFEIKSVLEVSSGGDAIINLPSSFGTFPIRVNHKSFTMEQPYASVDDRTVFTRMRGVCITNTGNETMRLLAVRLVDADGIDEFVTEGDGSQFWGGRGIFALKDDYDVSSLDSKNAVRIPPGSCYFVNIECKVDSRTQTAHYKSWIVAFVSKAKFKKETIETIETVACPCSVLVASSDVFSVRVGERSNLNADAVAFVPDSFKIAFDRAPIEFFPPQRNFLKIIWGECGSEKLSGIESDNKLLAPANYYAEFPEWLHHFSFSAKIFLNFSENSRPPLPRLETGTWTKKHEWDSVFYALEEQNSSNDLFRSKLRKSARLLYIEEAQHNIDIKKYDMFNAKLRKKPEPNDFDNTQYVLVVPGISNGNLPIVVGDCIRARVQSPQNLGSYLEYGFRVVAIISSNQTIHLESPWSRSYFDFLPDEMTAHVRFAYDENFFTRCRAAMRHCASLRICYDNSSIGKFDNQAFERLGHLGINAEQQSFVKRCSLKRQMLLQRGSDPDAPLTPVILIGPPGTGKTLTIAHAVLDALRQDPEARILVCAPSPFAADVVLDRIVKEHPKYFDGTIASPMVFLRIDDPRRGESEKMQSITAFSAPVISWFANKLEKNHEKQLARVLVCSCMSAGLLHQAHLVSRETKVDFLFRSFFENKTWVYHNDQQPELKHERGLTHLFFDECGQATICEAMIPLSVICGTQTVIALAGDPKQLGPLVHSTIASRAGLAESLIETCVNMIAKSEEDKNDENMIQLTKNYRSHPDILAIASEYFYGGLLESKASADDIRLPAGLNLGKNYRNVFIGVEGVEKVELTQSQSKMESRSYSNTLECERVCQIVLSLIEQKLKPRDIEIICVYRRQVLLLRLALRNAKLGEIRVGTIDDYQGQEAKVIILSTVATTGPHHVKSGITQHSILSDATRFNVATSRAKALQIIVGHPKALLLFPNWSRIIRNCVRKEGLKDLKMASPSDDEESKDKNSSSRLFNYYIADDVDEVDHTDKVLLSVFEEEDMPWRVQL